MLTQDVRSPERSTPGEAISVASVGRGVAWNALASVAPQLLTLVLSIAVGRILGPAEQGVQSFMIFVASTASVVCALEFVKTTFTPTGSSTL